MRKLLLFAVVSLGLLACKANNPEHPATPVPQPKTYVHNPHTSPFAKENSPNSPNSIQNY